jgi:hypothetical protein
MDQSTSGPAGRLLVSTASRTIASRPESSATTGATAARRTRAAAAAPDDAVPDDADPTALPPASVNPIGLPLLTCGWSAVTVSWSAAQSTVVLAWAVWLGALLAVSVAVFGYVPQSARSVSLTIRTDAVVPAVSVAI